MLSDEEDEDDDLEEENLPPWRQLKPWRWQPPEEDLGWLKIFQLPKVQVDEAGRSYIIGFYATGICIFFTFVWWGNPGSAFTAATGQAFLVMAEARAAAPDGASGASSPVEAPGKRLLESTLYKEDVLVNEHTAVWGSLFDPESKRWGYKCCKVMEKNGMCTAEKAPEPEANSSDLDNSPDSEDLLGPLRRLSVAVGLGRSWGLVWWAGLDATAWVEHFVRYHVGAWQRKADENYKGFPDLAEILIRRLHNPRELDRGEKTVRRGRETRAGMEGRVQEEMLGTRAHAHGRGRKGGKALNLSLLAWASAAASWPASTCDGEGDDSSCGFGLVQTRAGRAEHGREAARSRQRRPLPAWQQRAYLVGASHKAGTEMLHHIMKWTFDVLGGTDSCDYDANGGPITAYSPMRAEAGYMKLTLGNKTWNNTFVAHVAACTMKGDNYNTYDMDPDSQKYMHALLKLVHRSQRAPRGPAGLGASKPFPKASGAESVAFGQPSDEEVAFASDAMLVLGDPGTSGCFEERSMWNEASETSMSTACFPSRMSRACASAATLEAKPVYIAHRSSELVEAKGSEGRGGPEEEAQAAPKRKPWRLSRTHVPDHFDRLLTGYPKSELLETALGIGFAFRTPRDKVLSVAALLAASTPLAAYNVTYHYEKWRPTYNNGTSPYVNWCENSTVDCLTLENATMGEALAEIEASIFTASREEIKTAAGDHYVQDHFLGLRESTCENTESTGERCFGDEGVAMSFYEDDDSKILVFQAGLGESDRNNLLWQNKAWIIESFEAAMKEQKAADAYEFPLRCGFLDEAYSPIIDKSGLTLAVESVAQTTLEDEGLWPLIKLIVRERLTEGVTEAKTVYLAGTGLGGSHAALVSIFRAPSISTKRSSSAAWQIAEVPTPVMLRKNEDKSYDTYLIAAPGFQCIARDKYSKDLTPSDTHSQLMIYTHVMDALAGSVDQYSGTVCHYGLRNFTSSESFYDYCSRMIGHTGPEIFWRSTTVTTTTAEDATEEDLELIAEYAQNISSAQEDLRMF
eukprot:g11633.t1